MTVRTNINNHITSEIESTNNNKDKKLYQHVSSNIIAVRTQLSGDQFQLSVQENFNPKTIEEDEERLDDENATYSEGRSEGSRPESRDLNHGGHVPLMSPKSLHGDGENQYFYQNAFEDDNDDIKFSIHYHNGGGSQASANSFQIKDRNPRLHHTQVLNGQEKFIGKLSEDSKKRSIKYYPTSEKVSTNN